MTRLCDLTRLRWLLLCVLAVFVAACASPPKSSATKSAMAPIEDGLRTQAIVMSMADDYISALGESMYLLTHVEGRSTKSRWLSQSFLRNGVGSAIDIGAGPNPPVNLLDLLVLSSLQSWSFEHHWMPAGIGDAGLPALARLRQAELELWEDARGLLSDEQIQTLHQLVDAWITQHPDRTVVALVRFNEFADERQISSLSLRRQATGLLRQVTEATGAIDDARLLGERMLWYAGRYPYVLGEQAELTAYRLLDQPEGDDLASLARALRELADSVRTQLGSIQAKLDRQQHNLFEGVAAERQKSISQAQEAIQQVVTESLERASREIDRQRVAAVDHFFTGLDRERTALLDDLAKRQGDLHGLLADLHDTINASGTLASELTETISALDRLASRFDHETTGGDSGLSLADVRNIATEAGHAAERMTRVLELTNELANASAWKDRVSQLSEPANAIVDRAFWRGLVLIAVFIGGLALLRLVPSRVTGGTASAARPSGPGPAGLGQNHGE